MGERAELEGQPATEAPGATVAAAAAAPQPAAVLARAIGNRAMNQVLARRGRRYQDSPLGNVTPTGGSSYVDQQLTRLQASGRGSGRNVVRLGALTGLTAGSADEQYRVKYLIWQYFEFNAVANAEIDAVIDVPRPIAIDDADPLGGLSAPTSDRFLWTLRFTTANGVTDVEADRIGPDDSGLSIARVRGFPGVGVALTALQTWVRTRYPSLASVTVPAVAPAQVGGAPPTEAAIATANARTAQAYLAAVDAERRTQVRTAAWFATNYDIEILTAATSSTRMQTAHHWVDARREGMRDMEPERLDALEMALETIGTPFLTALRGIKVGRQRIRRVPGARGSFSEDANTYGETVRNGSDVTILLYDSHANQDDRRFVGSRNRGVRRSGVMQILHELGHAVSYRTSGLESAFQTRFAGTASPTAYGRSGGTEEFPEAFALYHADPDYLHDEMEDMYTWLDQASTSGTAPPPPPRPRR